MIFIATMACSTATTSKYSGDGVFTDRGIGANRPRYEIQFPEISLAKPGEYVFESEGLPPVPLTFALELADLHKHEDEMRASFRENPNEKWAVAAGKDRYEETKRIQTWIEVRFSTDGRLVASNAGSIKNSWTLQWTPAQNSGSLWHPNCRDIQFKRNRPTIIRIQVKNVDADALPIAVVPVLSGGGVEFP